MRITIANPDLSGGRHNHRTSGIRTCKTDGFFLTPQVSVILRAMIVKAALLLFRDGRGAKELMFVRPHNKPFYVFPGGKQEAGETIEQALAREIQEELSAGIDNVKKLDAVTGQTPDGRDLEMHLFTADLLNEPKASGEIAEIVWLDRQSALKNKDLITPITLDHVMPLLAQKDIW